MNLHHLKYFLIIAEEGSLTAASKKLLVGQPALSAQLKLFEEWLGVSLFERHGKKLTITASGEYVLKYAKAIKGLEDELVSNLGHANQKFGKEINLGAQESVPKSVIAHVISTIRSVKPVHLKIIEGTGDELFELLMSNKIDIYLGNFRPMSASREIIYKSLSKEAVSVWGSKEFTKYKKNFPKSLENLSFILPGFQNYIRHEFEKYMLQAGLSFDVAIEAQDTSLQKELAARGDGLVLLGEDSAKAWVNAGRLIKIGDVPGLKEEYWLGMVKRTLDNQLIKSIMEAL
jgi:LysR family transcriptional regulator, transcriptional activator of nhaA